MRGRALYTSLWWSVNDVWALAGAIRRDDRSSFLRGCMVLFARTQLGWVRPSPTNHRVPLQLRSVLHCAPFAPLRQPAGLQPPDTLSTPGGPTHDPCRQQRTIPLQLAHASATGCSQANTDATPAPSSKPATASPPRTCHVPICQAPTANAAATGSRQPTTSPTRTPAAPAPSTAQPAHTEQPMGARGAPPTAGGCPTPPSSAPPVTPPATRGW